MISFGFFGLKGSQNKILVSEKFRNRFLKTNFVGNESVYKKKEKSKVILLQDRKWTVNSGLVSWVKSAKNTVERLPAICGMCRTCAPPQSQKGKTDQGKTMETSHSLPLHLL